MPPAHHLVEQGTDLGAVVGIPVGQHRSDDPAGVGVRRKMQHSPGPAPLGAVLLHQPLARATELQPRAAPRDEEWLLIERPEDDAEPAKYWLATVLGAAALNRAGYRVRC